MIGRRKFIFDVAKGLVVPFVAPQIIRAQGVAANRRLNFQTGGAGSSCPADGSPSASGDSTTSRSIAVNTATRFHGQSGWNDGGTPRTICKVAFKLLKEAGSISGKTYTAYIYSMTGSSLNAILATSTGVTGDNAWNATWVPFTFPTPFLTTPSVNYAIVVTPGADDGANNAAGYGLTASSDTIPGHWDWFDNTGACSQCSGANDAAIRIYWQ